MYLSICASLFTYSLSLSLSSSLSIYLSISLLVFFSVFVSLFLSIFFFKPISNCIFFSSFSLSMALTSRIFHPSLTFYQHIYISFPLSYSLLPLISPAACISALLLYYSLDCLFPNINLFSSVGGCFFISHFIYNICFFYPSIIFNLCH